MKGNGIIYEYKTTTTIRTISLQKVKHIVEMLLQARVMLENVAKSCAPGCTYIFKFAVQVRDYHLSCAQFSRFQALASLSSLSL